MKRRTHGVGLEALHEDAVEEGDDGADGLERGGHCVRVSWGRRKGVGFLRVVTGSQGDTTRHTAGTFRFPQISLSPSLLLTFLLKPKCVLPLPLPIFVSTGIHLEL